MTERTTKEAMTEIYGKSGMARPPSRNELYEAVDIITEAMRSHKKRLSALEEGKPRVRVSAGSKQL